MARSAVWFAFAIAVTGPLLAFVPPSQAQELRPATCTGSIVGGAQGGAVQCTKIVFTPHQDGATSITFVVRDAAGAWFLVQAVINDRGVVEAADSAGATPFKISSFFIQPASDNQANKTVRWPLQGSCKISKLEIGCSANDTMIGFDVQARM